MMQIGIGVWIFLVFWLIIFILLPIGIIKFNSSRKRRSRPITGAVLIFVSLVLLVYMLPTLFWLYDLAFFKLLEVPVSVGATKVILTQIPGEDFYTTYFEVVRSDGKSDMILISADDMKWFRPGIAHRDGKIYFLRGFGKIDNETSFIDPAANTLYSGDLHKTFKFSEITFK
jgi:hypothetical protein